MEIANTIYSMISADYLSAHPNYAILISFLAAFGEALLVIGLFVPSTVVLVGAGTLIGAGHLEFWPIFLAAAIGCIAGDQISYWAGRWYGDRLKLMWPLRNYPQLLEKGEVYVREHGGKSIAIGRFVPGIKAVVPGIVGMLKMNQLYFFTVNIFSGILWAAAHVLPGVLIGRSLALAGAMSERLLIVLLVLLVILALAGWLVRLAVGSLVPFIDSMLWSMSAWAGKSRMRSWRRLGLALRPDRPRAKLLVVLGVLSMFALLLLADMVSGLVIRNALSNLDLSVQNVMSQLRSAPGDELMIPVTMLGDVSTVYIIGLAIVGWLLWRRAWHSAVAASATFAVARLTEAGLKQVIGRSRPPGGAILEAAGNFSFPSGHAVMAGTAFGVLALVAGQSMGRWSKAIVIAACSSVAIAVAFSRVYLGVHWFSDVAGGLLIALVIVTVFGVALEAFPVRRLRPVAFICSMVTVIGIYGTYHINAKYERNTVLYAHADTTNTFSVADWQAGRWQELAQKRVDLAGTPEENFVAQWGGTPKLLQDFAGKQGWLILPPWQWHDSLSYLDDKIALDKVPPRPLLHEGLPAVLTAIVPESLPSATRLVLRAYHSNAKLSTSFGGVPVLLISLTREKLHSQKLLFAIPMRVAPQDENLPNIFAGPLQFDAGAKVTQTVNGPTLILAQGVVK
jgi:membrane protein DedA with SNARE-associated domain/membrane-associated phospholipid phosphatase